MSLLLNIAAQVNANALPKANIETTLPNVLKIVFTITALLSITFIVIGGLKYTLSGGDAQGIAKAKNTILYAIVGLVVTLSAFTIMSFVAGNL